MNKIKQLFETKKEHILSIYFTAGYPNLDDTGKIILELQSAGVDMIEVGIPYSDPLADGEVIQSSGKKALENGMSIDLLFEQLSQIKDKVNIPLIAMGYYNQLLQYGAEKFCKKCVQVGISGLIFPDLPLEIYLEEYKGLFEDYNLCNIFLIAPQTSDERIKKLDKYTSGFLYIVSSASTTGIKSNLKRQKEYFERIKGLNLHRPKLIGFGISDNKTFLESCKYASGAIIGSAFINYLSTIAKIKYLYKFVKKIKSQ